MGNLLDRALLPFLGRSEATEGPATIALADAFTNAGRKRVRDLAIRGCHVDAIEAKQPGVHRVALPTARPG